MSPSIIALAIQPTSALIVIAVLIGAGVRVALLLHQRRTMWTGRQR